MSRSGFLKFPAWKRLARTTFWTFLILAVALNAYGVATEYFGIGLWVPNHPPVPKLHMRIEVRANDVPTAWATWGLALSIVWVALFNWRLAAYGLLALLGLSILSSCPRF